MADTLITGTTLVEKESRSVGDISIGGIIEWDDTFVNIPESFVLCDGATITDPLSSYNGSAVPNLNTQYWSIPGIAFAPHNSTFAYDFDITVNATLISTAESQSFSAQLNLPDGATITAVNVFGTDDGEVWTYFLTRITLTNDGVPTEVIVANGAHGTEDTSITSGIINNSGFAYYIRAVDVDSPEGITGARITYTPRFKFIIRIK